MMSSIPMYVPQSDHLEESEEEMSHGEREYPLEREDSTNKVNISKHWL